MQWDNLSLSIGSPSTILKSVIEENVDENASPGTYRAYSERLETYLVPLVLGIIFLVGLIGNGCLICIFCREPSVRSSVPNTFILNLALGDLLVLFCSVPFTSTIYTFESWPYGEFVCKASEFAKDTSVGVSVFTLTALSLERFIAIVRPVQSFANGHRSKLGVVISLSFIWILSIALAIPALFFAELNLILVPSERYSKSTMMTDDETQEVEVEDPVLLTKNITICYPFPERFGPDYPKFVVLVRFLIHYFIPLLIIGTLYAVMAYYLVKSTYTLPGEATLSRNCSERRCTNQGSGGSAAQLHFHSQSRLKVAKTVLSFTVLFAICFLPLHVFFFWFYFNPDALETYNIYWHSLKIVGFCLAYTNSSINPIALYCISTTFRQYFNRLFSACCRGKKTLDKDGSISRAAQRTHSAGGHAADHPNVANLLEPTFIRGRNSSISDGGRPKESVILVKSESNISIARPTYKRHQSIHSVTAV